MPRQSSTTTGLTSQTPSRSSEHYTTHYMHTTPDTAIIDYVQDGEHKTAVVNDEIAHLWFDDTSCERMYVTWV